MPDVSVIQGDCREVMAQMETESFDAIVTDAPYGLEFMGKEWDSFGGRHEVGKRGGTADKGILPGYGRGGSPDDRVEFKAKSSLAFQQFIYECSLEMLRVLKPGGHLIIFGGTRTFHRLACAVEDAGFEIRDCLAWLYGSGFPKSHNLDNEWQGWGTNLKPAFEPIVIARNPLSESTVAANVLKYSTGAINIDATRIGAIGRPLREIDPKAEANGAVYAGRREAGHGFDGGSKAIGITNLGRWPANVVISHSADCTQVGTRTVKGYNINRFDDGAKPFGGGAGHSYTSESLPDEEIAVFECEPECAVRLLDEQSGERPGCTSPSIAKPESKFRPGQGNYQPQGPIYADTGGASRFFYTSKAASSERNERTRQVGLKNIHPTVKPLDLMQWLCRLVCPSGGTILDPFAGSGTTGVAALMEGMHCTLIEREPEYVKLCHARIDGVQIGGLFDKL